MAAMMDDRVLRGALFSSPERALNEYHDDLFSDRGSQRYSERFMSRTRELFRRVQETKAYRRTLGTFRRLQNRGRVDAVCQLTEIGEMQNATPAMQRIVMANPTIKQLYRRKAIEGWVDTYEDYNDNAIEHTDQTYRQVMSSVVREDGLAYTYHMTKDEQYEFDENDKADARITWAAFKAQIKRKGDDPTSTWNAALV